MISCTGMWLDQSVWMRRIRGRIKRSFTMSIVSLKPMRFMHGKNKFSHSGEREIVVCGRSEGRALGWMLSGRWGNGRSVRRVGGGVKVCREIGEIKLFE